MAITADQAYEHIEHTLAGSPSVSPNEILNDAGEYFASMNRWRFLERRSARLSLRGQDACTDGDWTEATLTLTSSGSLTPWSGYDFVAGDLFEPTGGTSVVTDKVEIASKTDANTIVLKSTLTTTGGNLANADIAGKIEGFSVALPSDFGELQAYDATDSLVNSLNLTDKQHLLELRTNQVVVTAWNFWGTVSYAPAAGSVGGAPVPILEIWPAPASDDTEGLTIFYRAKWRRISSGGDFLDIPEYTEPLFKQVLRAFARGYEEEDTGAMDARLSAIEQGRLFHRARQHDVHVNVDAGPIRNGAVQSIPRSVNKFLRTTVAGPS